MIVLIYEVMRWKIILVNNGETGFYAGVHTNVSTEIIYAIRFFLEKNHWWMLLAGAGMLLINTDDVFGMVN